MTAPIIRRRAPAGEGFSGGGGSFAGERYSIGTDSRGKYLIDKDTGKKYYAGTDGTPVSYDDTGAQDKVSYTGKDGKLKGTLYPEFSQDPEFQGAWNNSGLGAQLNSTGMRDSSFLTQAAGTINNGIRTAINSLPKPPTQAELDSRRGMAQSTQKVGLFSNAQKTKLGDTVRKAGSALDGLESKARDMSGSTNFADLLGGGMGGSFGGGGGGFNMPSLPQAPQYQFRQNDFMTQALEAAAAAYAPQYQILDNNKTSAQGQYDRSSQVVSGLYNNLDTSQANQATKTAQEYAQAGTNRAAQGTQQVQEIGNIYQNANNEQAALLASLGIQDAYKGAAADQAWQQGQATQNTANQQDYIQNTGQNQADFAQNVRTATQTQGKVSQENLINDLASVLQGIDNQRLDVASGERQSAQSLNNQLRAEDMQFQQLEYQALMDAYRNQMTGYDAQVRGMGMQQDMANTAFNQNLSLAQLMMDDQRYQQGAENSRANTAYNRQRDQVSDQQWRDEMGRTLANDEFSQNMALMELMSQQGGSPSDPMRMESLAGQAQNLTPNNPQMGNDIYALADQIYLSGAATPERPITGIDGKAVNNMYDNNYGRFIQEVDRQARARGLDPSAARIIADEYAKQIMGR